MRSKYIGIKYLALTAHQIDRGTVGSSPSIVGSSFPSYPNPPSQPFLERVLKAGNRVVIDFQPGCTNRDSIGHIDTVGERHEIAVKMKFCDRFLNPRDFFGITESMD